jgi:hypothetical protein
VHIARARSRVQVRMSPPPRKPALVRLRSLSPPSPHAVQVEYVKSSIPNDYRVYDGDTCYSVRQRALHFYARAAESPALYYSIRRSHIVHLPYGDYNPQLMRRLQVSEVVSICCHAFMHRTNSISL